MRAPPTDPPIMEAELLEEIVGLVEVVELAEVVELVEVVEVVVSIAV